LLKQLKLCSEILTATRKATMGMVDWGEVEATIDGWHESALVANSGTLDALMFTEEAYESPLPNPSAVLLSAEAGSSGREGGEIFAEGIEKMGFAILDFAQLGARSCGVESGSRKKHAARTVTLSGPSGTNLNTQNFTEDSNFNYSYSIGAPGQIGSNSLLPGTYTLVGQGGTSVGPVGSTSITLGSPLSLSSPLPTAVTESAG
jgi:hypothetical protein